MKKVTAVAFSCVLLLMSACSKRLNEELRYKIHYYQIYEVIYDKVSNKTYISVQFRNNSKNGERPILQGAEFVTVNGIPPNADNNSGAGVYEWKFDTVGDYTISLIKADDTISNLIAFADVAGIDFHPKTPDKASQKEGFTAYCLGFDPKGDKKVSLSIRGEGLGTERTFTADSMYISPEDLEQFNPGVLKLSLRSKLTAPPKNQDSLAGGIMYISMDIVRELPLSE